MNVPLTKLGLLHPGLGTAFFTESALWANLVSKSQFCMSVSSPKTRFQVDWRLLVEEHIAYIGILLHIFCLSLWWFFTLAIFFPWVLGSLQTSLLCIIGQLTWVESVSVADGLSDRWQVTCTTLQVTHDTWLMTCTMWQLTPDIWHLQLFSSCSFL